MSPSRVRLTPRPWRSNTVMPSSVSISPRPLLTAAVLTQSFSPAARMLPVSASTVSNSNWRIRSAAIMR